MPVLRPYSFPPSSGQQALHNVVLRICASVVSGTVFFHDLEDLIPEPVCLRHVVLAHSHIRRLDRITRRWMFCEEPVFRDRRFTPNPARRS